MQQKRVFISSVQAEFIEERELLAEYLRSDALLSKFFDVFFFENFPANNKNSGKVYLDEVKKCDIYIGLFGIVNSVAHRDYTSNASIQVVLFKDRLEVWNPGHLPHGMTVEKLKQKHSSIPVNLLIAEPLYLAGTIERMGTGTGDIIKQCKKAGLKSPEFVEEEDFRVVLWRDRQLARRVVEKTSIKHQSSTHQAPINYSLNILQLLSVIKGEMTRQEIQNSLNLSDRVNLRSLYLQPALEQGLIAMKFPKKNTHPGQRYYLTSKGIEIKNKKAF